MPVKASPTSFSSPPTTDNGNKTRGKLSRQHKPLDLTLEEWQTGLRRQFGRTQQFQLDNVGGHPIFSEFRVDNPASKSTYQVIIRGTAPGDNYCSCGDFATNTLGTCKHIEFTLGRLEQKRGGVTALARGYQHPASEVFLHYGAQREVCFRPGSECPPAMARLAAHYFGSDGTLLPEAFGRFDRFLSEAGKIDHPLQCREDVLQ